RTPSVPRATCSAASFSSTVLTLPRSVTMRSSVSTVTDVAFTRLSAKSRALVFEVSQVSLTGDWSAIANPGPHTIPAIATQIAMRFMVSLLSSATTTANFLGPVHPHGLAVDLLDLVTPVHRLALVLRDLVAAIQAGHLLLRALHFGPYATELDAKVLRDAPPALAARSLGEDLIEGALLVVGLVMLHELLGERQGNGGFTESHAAIPHARHDRGIDLELLGDGFGDPLLTLRRHRLGGIGVDFLRLGLKPLGVLHLARIDRARWLCRSDADEQEREGTCLRCEDHDSLPGRLAPHPPPGGIRSSSCARPQTLREAGMSACRGLHVPDKRTGA